MPRFEREGQAWEIRLDGNVFHVTSEGKTTTRKFIGAEQAKVQYDKLVARQISEGFREVAEVVVAPEARDEDAFFPPDDLEALAVHGDALASAGDFRGELIALHLGIHRLRDATDEDAVEERHRLARRSQRLLMSHHEEIYGPLARITRSVTRGGVAVKRTGGLVTTWALGVIEGARLCATGSMSVGEAYMELRTLPATEHLRELAFGPTVPGPEAAQGFSYDAALDAIERYGAPARLTTLVLDGASVPAEERPWVTPAEVDRVSVGDVSRMWRHAPTLERLVLVGSRAVLDGPTPPALRAVELCGASATLAHLEWVAEIPTVREVVFMPSTPDITLSDVLARLAPLPIERLTVRGCPFGDPGDVISFPGLASLRYLDVAANGLGEEGATALCAGASKLAHLDELDVRQNNISNEQVRAIRAALPMSRAYGQWDVEFEVDGGVDALFDALRE